MDDGLRFGQASSKINQTRFRVICDILPATEHKAITSFYNQATDLLLSEESIQRFFVGYVNGKLISLSFVYLERGLASVFDIIVLPGMREKGKIDGYRG